MLVGFICATRHIQVIGTPAVVDPRRLRTETLLLDGVVNICETRSKGWRSPRALGCLQNLECFVIPI